MKLTGLEILKAQANMRVLVGMVICDMLHLIFLRMEEALTKEKKYIDLGIDKITKAGAKLDKDKNKIYEKVPEWIEGKEEFISKFVYKDEIATNRLVDEFLEKEIEINIDPVKFETLKEAEAKFQKGISTVLKGLNGTIISIKELNDLQAKIDRKDPLPPSKEPVKTETKKVMAQA